MEEKVIKPISLLSDKSDTILTVIGLYKNGYLFIKDGVLDCVTYGSKKKIWNNCIGYYNLIYKESIDEWVISNYVPLTTK